VQPAPELAGREVHEPFGPCARPAVGFAGREVGRTVPVRQGELGRVLDAQTSLLGGVDEEEAAEGPPGLAPEARGRLGVEEDEMRRVFNLGIGFAAVIETDSVPAALTALERGGCPSFVAGNVVEGAGVRFR